MKVILESESEVKLWDILLAAHYKWEKNHGDSIRDQMEWYFFDLFKDETDEIIKAEVQKRLVSDYKEVIDVTEEQYIIEGLNDNDYETLSAEEVEKLKIELAEEYQLWKEDYEDAKEMLPSEIKDKITSFYYNLFNAPEYLTIEFNGQIIRAKQ